MAGLASARRRWRVVGGSGGAFHPVALAGRQRCTAIQGSLHFIFLSAMHGGMSSAASFAFVTYCGLGIGLDGSPRGAARSQRVKVAVAFRGELI